MYERTPRRYLLVYPAEKIGNQKYTDNVTAYIKALTRLTEDQALADKLISNAFSFAEKELTFNHRMFQTLEVYNAVIK